MVSPSVWKDHLLLQLHKQQLCKELCDLKLVAGNGESVYVHACVIAALSPGMAVQKNQWRTTHHGEIMLGCDRHVIDCLVQFLYTGIVSTACRPGDLLDAASELGGTNEFKDLVIGSADRGKEEIELGKQSDCEMVTEDSKLSNVMTAKFTENLQTAELERSADDMHDFFSWDLGKKTLNEAGHPTEQCHNNLLDHKTTCEMAAIQVDLGRELCSAGAKQEPGTDTKRNEPLQSPNELTSTKDELQFDTTRMESGEQPADNQNLFLEISKSNTGRKIHVQSTHDKLTCNGDQAAVKCSYCSEKFGTKKLMYGHCYREHREECQYPCEVCSKRYRTKRSLYDHKLRTHPECLEVDQCRWKCQYCSDEFRSKLLLYKHCDRTHQQKYEYLCDICHKMFRSKRSRRDHMYRNHGHKGKSRPRDVKKAAVAHEGPHHGLPDTRDDLNGQETYACDVCQKTFQTSTELAVHEDRVHTQGYYPCDHCSQDFRTTRFRSLHILRVHKDAVNVFHKCDDCGRSFSSKRGLHHHVMLTHVQSEAKSTASSTLVCSTCGKKLSNIYTLSKHEERHQPPKYKCEQCEKVFKDKDSLETHKKIIHEQMIVYLCEICGEKPRSRGMYAHHLWRAHQIKPANRNFLSCSYCGMVYLNRHALQKHVRKHEGWTCSCDLCGKTFRYEPSLERHVSAAHKGEKAYSCQFCSKAFAQKVACQAHERTHTGEKPYQCKKCMKCFTQSGSLRSHEKNCGTS